MTRFRIVAALLVALTLGALPVAQEKSPTRPRIEFKHDGQRVTGFALYARPEVGPERRFDLGHLVPDSAGTVSAAVPPLPAGRYTLSVAAYNAAGESRRVSTVRFTVTPDMARSAEPATPSPAPVPSAPAASAPTAAPKSGFWGRFWTLVVGED